MKALIVLYLFTATLLAAGCVKEHQYAFHGVPRDSGTQDAKAGPDTDTTVYDVPPEVSPLDLSNAEPEVDADTEVLTDILTDEMAEAPEIADGSDLATLDSGDVDLTEAVDLVCQPQCEDKDCGEDGCDGTCGACEAGYDCSDNICVGDCVWLCDDFDCGTAGLADECGCGTCDEGYECETAAGTCTADCPALCGTKECGQAGLSQECNCGTCSDNYDCAIESGMCAADCPALCGPATCGAAGIVDECPCGSCPENYACEQGTCTANCGAICGSLDCGTAGEEDECDCGQCNDDDICTQDFCTDNTCPYEEVTCDDGVECTADICDSIGGCSSTLNEDSCLIDGLCYTEPESKPDYPCFLCVPHLFATDWTPAPPLAPCNPEHVLIGTCQGPNCVVTSCQEDFADCDSDGNNGCEAHMKESFQHCGQCNHPCDQGQSCVNGDCV